MRKRFVLLFFAVFAAVGIMACGGTGSDFPDSKIEEKGINLIFSDPNYSGCDSTQRALLKKEDSQIELQENDFLITRENQISDSAMNQISIEELQNV